MKSRAVLVGHPAHPMLIPFPFAFDDHCTHKGGSLAGGIMLCGTVQCLWHGSRFDVHTGEVKGGLQKSRLPPIV